MLLRLEQATRSLFSPWWLAADPSNQRRKCCAAGSPFGSAPGAPWSSLLLCPFVVSLSGLDAERWEMRERAIDIAKVKHLRLTSNPLPTGSSRRPTRARPAVPNRSVTGQGCPGHERGVDPVLQGAAVMDEVQAPSRSRALRTSGPGSQPKRQQLRLAGKGCEALHLVCVGVLDRPAGELQGVVNEASAFINSITPITASLNAIALLRVWDEVAKAVSIRGPCRDLEDVALVVHDIHVEARPAHVHSNVWGPPSRSWFR